MQTLTIKIPLFEPTATKQKIYEHMSECFSEACNQALRLKKEEPNLKSSEIDRLLSSAPLPSTLIQEARKLAISRYQDWRKNQKTKGFPSFKRKMAISFNNQNWRFRFDNGFLKLGIPTIEGTLTTEKYVPLKVNDYTMFWVQYLLTGKIDKQSRHYRKQYERISKPKKGNGQLFCKKGTWFFSFVVSFKLQSERKTKQKSIGVDRGLRHIAVAGDKETGNYLIFDGKHTGHLRRKYSKLRRSLQKAKNMKALKRLEDKEYRTIQYWNHVFSKRIVEFAQAMGASMIKIEDLKNIRSMKKFWKRSDRNIHSWAFFGLETKLIYKAQLAELTVVKVSPYKTSQECSRCGKARKSNRRSSLYTCSCGYKHEADVNASFVIAARPSIEEMTATS